MRRLAFALALATAASPAAAEVQLLSGFISKHSSGRFNERNPGLGLKVGDWGVGWYRNSESTGSWYAVREWQWGGTVKVGAIAGLVTGYKLMDVMPMAAPTLSITIGRTEVLVMAIPGFGGYASVAAVQARWRIR